MCQRISIYTENVATESNEHHKTAHKKLTRQEKKGRTTFCLKLDECHVFQISYLGAKKFGSSIGLTNGHGCKNPSPAENNPNGTEGLHPHLLFSNLASFDSLSNWCSALDLTKDWVKPIILSRMGKVRSSHLIGILSFTSKGLNLSLVRSSASTLVSRGLQLSLQRIF